MSFGGPASSIDFDCCATESGDSGGSHIDGKSGFEGVFLIRGNKEEAEAFEKRIRNVENFSNGIPSNVRMILRPENRKQTTVAVWIVPVGTEPPK